MSGSLETLQFVHEILGCSLDEDVAHECLCFNHLSLLKYIFAHGCPLDFDSLLVAIHFQRYDCFVYALYYSNHTITLSKIKKIHWCIQQQSPFKAPNFEKLLGYKADTRRLLLRFLQDCERFRDDISIYEENFIGTLRLMKHYFDTIHK